MNEGTLLAFGCAVTFIAASAAYVYIRGDFATQEQATEVALQSAERQKTKSGP